MKKGFTLIELLVVVLIIGILAAVALPQYQKAVERAKVARILPYLRSIVDAKKRYYMENGEWTADLDLLDVGFTYSSRTVAEDTGSWKYHGTPLNGDFNLPPTGDCVYWPGHVGDVNIDFCADKQICYGSTKLGDSICKSFGTRKYVEASAGGFPAYYMNF